MSDREHLISEKQNNKASAEGVRLPKESMLLRDIKFTKLSLDAFHPFGLISRACQGPRDPPNNINIDFDKLTQRTRLMCLLLLNEVHFHVLLATELWTKIDIIT